MSEHNTRTKCTACKLILWDGSSWIVWFWGEEGSEGRDRRRANSGDRKESQRKEHVRRRWRDVGCSHRQAHSSCNACWDALGSVLHNTITACSGVLCWAPLCSSMFSCLLLDFLCSGSLVCHFACFLLCTAHCASVQWQPPPPTRLFFFRYMFLNLLFKLSLNDQLKFLEQNISISWAFVVCLCESLCLKLFRLFAINCHISHSWGCWSRLLSSTSESQPQAWFMWLTGLVNMGVWDAGKHVVYPACLTVLCEPTDVSRKL